MTRKANPLRPGHLRAARLRLGLSQREVGERAGILQMYVSIAELGKSPRDVAKVMAALIQIVRGRRYARLIANRRPLELLNEEARIARQEHIWNAVPNSVAKSALAEAMIDRCFDLMCEGRGAECDAIAEWLPAPLVRAMFDAWESWCAGDPTDQEAEAPGNCTATPS